MKSSALATVHPLPPIRRTPFPLPSSGIASVTTLDTPLTRGMVAMAELQSAFEYDEPEVVDPPRLRLIHGTGGEIDRFAARFAQVLVEVFGGDRGVHQLIRWTTDRVYADLLRRAHALQQVSANAPRTRRQRAQIRSVHLCRPQDDAAELSIHVRHGRRSRAIAVRIEQVEDRWLCTAIEFG